MKPEDVDESWADLSPAGSDVLRGDHLDLIEHIRLAAAKTVADIETRQAPVPRDMMDAFEQRFVTHLIGDLRSVPLQGLLKYILEAPGLTSEEISGFLQALPVTMIEKLTATAVGKTCSGVHLLLALELHRRRFGERYQVSKLPAGGLRVVFYPARLNGSPMEVDLNEHFDVPEGK